MVKKIKDQPNSFRYTIEKILQLANNTEPPKKCNFRHKKAIFFSTSISEIVFFAIFQQDRLANHPINYAARMKQKVTLNWRYFLEFWNVPRKTTSCVLWKELKVRSFEHYPGFFHFFP